MKTFKSVLYLAITFGLVFFLNRGWDFGKPIPPLGKFLDPFHGFWQNADRSSYTNETLNIAGLKDEVTVIYDSAYIPHIFASNDADLFLAQGYVTARDRLWQMEFQVLAAAGRISEILGPKALDFDRNQRRIGMVFGAENTIKGLADDPEVMVAIEGYTAGINDYISQLKYEDFPIEYKLLDYSPESWNTLKVGLFFMNMAKTLNMNDHDLEMTNALKLFGKENVDLLYPDHELSADPIAENPGGWKFEPVKLSDSVALAVPDELIHIEKTTERARGVGSNNWVVSGSKTASRSPILCNDPHLSLSMPSIWHVVHLNAPGINTMGAAFPGSPCVILGFNDSIAWGCTNAQRDLVDWYKIEFRDKSRNEYLSDGAWRKSSKVIEKIQIKGKDPFYDTVVYTHHGPVVFDEHFHGENEKNHFAFRWIAHDASKPLKTFFMLDKAKNFDDYRDALNYHVSPAQNFVFGSVSGDIAIRVQGKFPVRRKNEGKFVLDGTKTSSEWHAFIPNEHNAVIKNPARGFLSSANQYPVDETYPYYVQTGEYYETYRNRRINQVLGSLNHITPADLMKLHNDNYCMQAAESVPAFLTYLDTTRFTPEEATAYHALRNWDFFSSIESEAAIYYEQWWNTLYPMIWDEMSGSKVSMDMPSEFVTIRLVKEKPDLSFFDIADTPDKETIKDVLQKSFSASVKEVEEWKQKHADKKFRWADFKDTYVQHLLQLPAFSYHPVNGGNSSIVNASSHRWGPSWRMVVSLEKSGVKAWGVYPGGQSGNPGSRFYNNLMDRWADGQYVRLLFTSTRDQLQQSAFMTTTLKPVSK